MPGGLSHDKLHIHFRLMQPARGDELAKLKRARRLAMRLAGGDASNVPIVHPIRWPGSWHRKHEPRLCEIETLEPDREIDLDAALDALEAALPGKDGNGFDYDAGGRQYGDDGNSDRERPDWAALVQNILAGKDLHHSTLRLAASYIGAGMKPEHVLRQLQALMLASTAPHDERWQARFADLARLVNDAQAKYGSDTNEQQNKETEKQRIKLPFLDISRWDADKPPRRLWALHDRIPLLQTSLYSGEGGGGKSNSWLQECYAHTIGRDWLGMLPEPGPAWFIECEDDGKELHRRCRCIADYYQTPISEAERGGLRLMSFAGMDAVLATVLKSGKVEPTALYKAILEEAGDAKPKMIGISSSANVFAGNENDRSQVQQFIGMLTRIAIVANGAVTLIGHPSLTGINTESGLSGTTQWHNAVRARFYLRTVSPDPGEPPDSDLRELIFKKNNYGPISASIILRYRSGLFLPEHSISGLDKLAHEAKADEIFLDLLKRFASEGRNVSHNGNSKTYAPTAFAQEAEAKKLHFRKGDLEAAMRRLFEVKKIRAENYGRPSRPYQRIIIV
jgi:RecA-family ATPase